MRRRRQEELRSSYRLSSLQAAPCEKCAELLRERMKRGGAHRPLGAIMYRGLLDGPEGERSWDQTRNDDLLHSHSPEDIARELAPFGSAERVAILYSLYREQKTNTALCEETGLTQGQLYHHIKDLVYLGYVQQSGRGSYHITLKGRQTLLTLAALIDDLARH